MIVTLAVSVPSSDVAERAGHRELRAPAGLRERRPAPKAGRAARPAAARPLR